MRKRDVDAERDYVDHLKRVERRKRTFLIAFAAFCAVALLCMAVLWR